ncbi:hypothetical protein HNO88_002798 [Novosphingobium chloroacetimidivorans]|uniref:Uncharacterized protein n=1 Tax=Novosphingobium chloroacetimidivorans TaxID=1428314 RepID=A0A7W7KAX5_9SPHN|nr:hypothetical protein [Novosphingobium chloroacetimidivorans]MBB4859469.1 hypothetical protein [Novosphingobium chloroacetimidivorans]
MAIVFPQIPFGSNTEITLNTSAADLKPFLAGPVQRLARLGDKWSLKIECRKMFAKQAGPVIAALIAGLAELVIIDLPQPGIDTSKWTTGNIAAPATGGRQIVVSGGGAPKVVGQMISIERLGVHYLHQITAVNGANLTIQPALKTPLAAGEPVEFARPKLMGFVAGNAAGWTVGLAENTGLSFVIDEAV